MDNTTPAKHFSRRIKQPHHNGQRRPGGFARQATIAEFGWRHARALDQGDFVDRKPHLTPIGPVAGRVLDRLAEVRNAS